MDYFSRPEVSNSDLSALKEYLECKGGSDINREKAYWFGSIYDAIVTEPHKIDFIRKRYNGIEIDPKLFALATRMKQNLLADELGSYLVKNSGKQRVITDNVKLIHNGIPFQLRMRCKLDFDLPQIRLASDLKSTAAATQQEFDNAVTMFDYDRQAAVYMTLCHAEKFIIIAASKRNKSIFKVLIDKKSPLYKSGMEKFTDLAFRWWMLFV